MSSIGKEFIEKTKYEYLEPSDQSLNKPQPPLALPYENVEKLIQLPQPQSITVNSVDLRMAIESRKSLRAYSKAPLKLEELSFLLWCTQGVKETVRNPKTNRSATFRTVPSAGARHAFETYLLINNVENLEPGLYRYLALEHKLAKINSASDIAEQIKAACHGQAFIGTSAVTFMWAAVASRMKWRYVERGYRYLFLDAGHVCQNLYLSAEAVDSGACAIAAYSDDDLNQVLGLDGKEQFVIYVAAVGKK